MIATQRLVSLTLYSALAYCALQISNLIANLLYLQSAAEIPAGSTPGKIIVSTVINLVVTLGLYFWVYKLLRQSRSLGRVLGSISAVVSGLGALIYALLIFDKASWVSIICLVLVVVNVLWMFGAWRRDATEELA